jgi:transposase
LDKYLYLEKELSTAWRINSEFSDQNLRLEERVGQLEREKAELDAKVKALHQARFKANAKKPGETAAGQPEPAQEAKKRGAPVGHAPWARGKPAAFDQTIEVPAPCVCPYCNCGDLEESGEVREHWQEDIILVAHTVATRYVHHEARCPKCGKAVIERGADQAGHIGPNAKALALYLRHETGLSMRKTQGLFKDLLGFNLASSSLFGFERAGVEKATPLYEDLAEKIRASDLVHADETHWRQDGVNHYIWFAGNEDLALFRIDRHRSTEAAQAILGKSFGGTLVTDGYAAYNGVGAKRRQGCLAHLIRHGKEIAEEIAKHPEKDQHAPAVQFCAGAVRLFREGCKAASEFRAGTRDWDLEAGKLGKEYEKNLDELCAAPLSYAKAETFRKRLLGKERDRWFAFLRHPGTPPTNNLAERALRPLVIRRKTSLTTRSAQGSENLGILSSLVQTAKLQGRHPLTFLKTLFVQGGFGAFKALYRSPSPPAQSPAVENTS